MDWRELDSATCSIARTMTVLGEPWAMLVLRDVLNGVSRFDDLVDHLGIARNVLTRRLTTLVRAGILETREYREPGRRTRHEYRPTAVGRDLRPVLLALMAFGDRHRAGPEGAPAVVVHDCGAEVHVREVCDDGHVLAPSDRVRITPGPGARRRSA
ncbi:winged helix-turn-helix transcriptional regulator [Actinomycetospora termitidis]|uniref:Helix-turn-helix domain-containing protein n=1 Tax=Actinomycetospora termitidis TaxID=3053470 RepID=A0ABT7MBF6_9PSEU|nr:helix-turn-helix domain-containing protein [Actinomycetospora sp. Odt1-22]MDL5156748.1 helix-turn-helix domain-containing protein [Actinomycetospora sp. Odt1-22]